MLTYRNTQLAVVEAKPDTAPLTEGVAQAKDYASKLQLRFTYASNGLGVYAIDMATGKEGKTSIAFQILWRLFQARWNLSGQPTRRPRILFLADAVADLGKQEAIGQLFAGFQRYLYEPQH